LKDRSKTSNPGDRTPQNIIYWFEYELRQYTSVDFDLTALGAFPDRLVLAGGRESRGYLPYLPNSVLARKFGLNILELPGGHLGYVLHATQFAQELIDALTQKDSTLLSFASKPTRVQ
jgi:hypothetical protein